MYGLGDEARQGLQGGAQRIQAAFKGSQAGLKLLVLGVQLGHEVVHDILGLGQVCECVGLVIQLPLLNLHTPEPGGQVGRWGCAEAAVGSGVFHATHPTQSHLVGYAVGG